MDALPHLQTTMLLAAAVFLPAGLIMIALGLRGRPSARPAAPARAASEPAPAAVPAATAPGVVPPPAAVTSAILAAASSVQQGGPPADRTGRRPVARRRGRTAATASVRPSPPRLAAATSGPDLDDIRVPTDTHRTGTAPAAPAVPAVRSMVRRALSRRDADASREPAAASGRGGTILGVGTIAADWIGAALVVRPAGGPVDDRLRALAHASPVEPTILTVVADAGLGAEDLLPHVRRAVESRVDPERTAVRLVPMDAVPMDAVPVDAGRPVGAGERTATGRHPAEGPRLDVTGQRLADGLRRDVIVPEGMIVPVPGGSLFVLAGRAPGAWRLHRHQGKGAATLGPRQPAPRWQPLLAAVPAGGHGGLSVHQVPAGLLLLPKAATHPAPDDGVYAVPVDFSRMHILVGRLGDEVVGDEEIAALLGSLPAELRHTARLVAYGTEPTRATPRGQAVADLLGAKVRTLVGVPMVDDGEVRVVVPAAATAPVWEPWASALTYRPARTAPPAPPSIDHWRSPAPDLTRIAPRVYRLAADWVVEVVPCGLWIRPDETRRPMATPAGMTAARALPFDPAGPTTLVGTPDVEVAEGIPPPVLDALERFTGAGGVRERLVILGSMTEAGRSALAELARRRGIELAHEPPAAADRPDTRETVPADEPPARPPQSVGEVPLGEVPLGEVPVGDEVPVREAQADGMPVGEAPTGELAVSEMPVGDATVVGAVPVGAVAVGLLAAGGEPRPAILPGHRSTAGERELFRRAMGDRYGTHLGALSALLAKVPALRIDDEDAAKADLLAVRTYLSDQGLPAGRTNLNAALRGPACQDPEVLAYAGCVASGLRRLPSFRGVAVCGADLSDREVALYTPGTILTEWAFADASTSAAAEFGTNAEYLIWCATGHRTAILADEADEAGLLFPPNTRFLVLGVRRTPGGPTRVLLRDAVRPTQPAVAAPAGWTPGPRDETALQRLTAAADRRDALDPGERPARPDGRRSAFPLGLSAAPGV